MLRTRVRAKAALVAAALLAGLVALPSEATTSFESPYTLAQTYNAALRLIRVDLGFRILERDPQAGYLLFEYQSSEGGRKPSAGSVQMVDTGRAVKVVVALAQMPRYHEQVLTDALGRKLREEYGDPPRRSPDAAPDAGPAE